MDVVRMDSPILSFGGPYTNGMGSFLNVVWVVIIVTKTIRGFSYLALIRGKGEERICNRLGRI